jgi:hypothetical protein
MIYNAVVASNEKGIIMYSPSYLSEKELTIISEIGWITRNNTNPTFLTKNIAQN